MFDAEEHQIKKTDTEAEKHRILAGSEKTVFLLIYKGREQDRAGNKDRGSRAKQIRFEEFFFTEKEQISKAIEYYHGKKEIFFKRNGAFAKHRQRSRFQQKQKRKGTDYAGEHPAFFRFFDCAHREAVFLFHYELIGFHLFSFLYCVFKPFGQCHFYFALPPTLCQVPNPRSKRHSGFSQTKQNKMPVRSSKKSKITKFSLLFFINRRIIRLHNIENVRYENAKQ